MKALYECSPQSCHVVPMLRARVSVAKPSLGCMGSGHPKMKYPTSPILHLPRAASHDTVEAQPISPAASSPGAPLEKKKETFNWHAHWYPIAIQSQLDASKPQAATILGIPLTIWYSKDDDKWVVFEDRCPHRLAPLSQGRLTSAAPGPRSNSSKGFSSTPAAAATAAEAAAAAAAGGGGGGGSGLMCSYHGWTFNTSGACTSIPQISSPTSEATALKSRRTCAAVFPSQLAQGLLWVWLDASPAAAATAAATPAALAPQLQDPAAGFTLLGGDWFQRDLLYGFETMMENLFDPSHIPYAHHGIMGTATRDKAIPLKVETLADVSAEGGFKLTRPTAPFQTPTPVATVNYFVPPVLCSSSQTSSSGRTTVLLFYGVPTMPGQSRIFAGFLSNAKIPAPVQKLFPAFEWMFHLGQNRVLDSDAMILHVQERLLAREQQQQQQGHRAAGPGSPPSSPSTSSGSGPWRSAFFLPAEADTGVIKFRTWFDRAGGSVPWPNGMSDTLGPVLDRRVVMDRYSQHVAGCKGCSRALKWILKLQGVALGLAAAAGAVAATIGANSLVVAAAVGGGGSSGTGSWLLGALPPAQQAPWVLVGAAGLGVLMLVAHWGLKQLAGRFLFVDYVHAEK